MASDREIPLSVLDTGGCICELVVEGGEWKISVIRDDCRYHQAAAEQPWNHGFPWNCPTYWNGCNCDEGGDDGE